MKLNICASNQIVPNYDIDPNKRVDSFSVNSPINIIAWLNRILVAEAKCVLRYRQHHVLTLGASKKTSNMFLNNANQKVQDVDAIALRITQLGGAPDLFSMNLDGQYRNGHSEKSHLVDMIKENLVAERLVVNSYRSILNYLSHRDPITTQMLEKILISDECRVNDLVASLVSDHLKIRLVVS